VELTVRILCRPEVAPGFLLAGLAVDEADETSIVAAMNALVGDPTTGVVIIEERLRRALPAELVHRLDRRITPIVVPFPSPSWGGRRVEEEYVLEILQQAVGYRVRLR
jgi:vacuolar-type H+-ATPase subunit F/Vma7